MLVLGDCLEILETLDANSIHACVTDPPYDLTQTGRSLRLGAVAANGGLHSSSQAAVEARKARGFLGQSWDGTGIAFRPETWQAVARVMRPGAFLLAFGSPRTYHRMTCAIEDAGFIIKDCVMFLHAQGFPKSRSLRDIGHPEMGSALKPSYEPIVMAQKPISEKSIGANFVRWGTGALNIDAARIAGSVASVPQWRSAGANNNWAADGRNGDMSAPHAAGRWPANVTFEHSPLCEEVGTRRVKGHKGYPNGPGGKSYQYSSDKRSVDVRPDAWEGYAAADGTEVVTAWACVEGGTFTSYAYAHSGGVAAPLDEPSYLLDRLQVLLQDLRGYSTPCNSLLLHASEFYRNEHKQSAALVDGLSDAVAYVLRVSELPGFQSGYQSYRGFCDAHLHQVLAACQDGLPSLVDALAHVHSVLSALVHTPHRRYSDLRSSSDAVPLNSTEPGMSESRTSDAHHVMQASHEQVDRIGDTVQSGQPQNGLHASRDLSSTSELDSHETPTDTAGISATVRLLSLFCIDLAWRFILPAHIIQRSEIVINLPSCPVAELDRQAGDRPAGYRANPSTPDQSRRAMGTFPSGYTHGERGYADTGGASRFYHVFKPEVDYTGFSSYNEEEKPEVNQWQNQRHGATFTSQTDDGIANGERTEAANNTQAHCAHPQRSTGRCSHTGQISPFPRVFRRVFLGQRHLAHAAKSHHATRIERSSQQDKNVSESHVPP